MKSSAVPVGRSAPDFTLPAVDGDTLRLADLAGSVLILVFFRGSWCPACRWQLGHLRDHMEEFAERDATIVAISADPMEASRETPMTATLPYPHPQRRTGRNDRRLRRRPVRRRARRHHRPPRRLRPRPRTDRPLRLRRRAPARPPDRRRAAAGGRPSHRGAGRLTVIAAPSYTLRRRRHRGTLGRLAQSVRALR